MSINEQKRIQDWEKRILEMVKKIKTEKESDQKKFEEGLYSWTYSDGEYFCLSRYDREELRRIFKKMASFQMDETKERVSYGIKQFIKGILWSQDTYRVYALLIDIFGEDYQKYMFSQSEGPDGYFLILYKRS
jgi:predicted thioredoxin/glutaredoxin